MAPMTRYNCSIDGSPRSELLEYYKTRAKNDLGLIIVESCAVNESHAKGYVNGAQFHSTKHADSWKPAIKEIQDLGSKIWVQLFHAGRLSVKEITGTKVLSPSPLKALGGKSYWRPEKDGEIVHFQTGTNFEAATEISLKEIKEVIDQFAKSCALAEQIGFDGVELHGAHGYLLHQFCHKETNVREDDYRAIEFKFIKELVQACRAAVSKDFTLAYRLSLHMVDSSYIRYDETQLDYSRLVQLLDEEGIDVFHSSELKIGAKMFGGDRPLHQLIKENTKKPIIACGSMKALDKANAILEKGAVDMIAFGRALISNPNLISSFRKDSEFKAISFKYENHINNFE